MGNYDHDLDVFDRKMSWGDGWNKVYTRYERQPVVTRAGNLSKSEPAALFRVKKNRSHYPDEILGYWIGGKMITEDEAKAIFQETYMVVPDEDDEPFEPYSAIRNRVFTADEMKIQVDKMYYWRHMDSVPTWHDVYTTHTMTWAVANVRSERGENDYYRITDAEGNMTYYNGGKQVDAEFVDNAIESIKQNLAYRAAFVVPEKEHFRFKLLKDAVRSKNASGAHGVIASLADELVKASQYTEDMTAALEFESLAESLRRLIPGDKA